MRIIKDNEELKSFWEGIKFKEIRQQRQQRQGFSTHRTISNSPKSSNKLSVLSSLSSKEEFTEEIDENNNIIIADSITRE